MAYCTHCGEPVSDHSEYHNCSKKGLLNVNSDDSFLVSTAIGAIQPENLTQFNKDFKDYVTKLENGTETLPPQPKWFPNGHI